MYFFTSSIIASGVEVSIDSALPRVPDDTKFVMTRCLVSSGVNKTYYKMYITDDQQVN
jgi:hypothetical protein